VFLGFLIVTANRRNVKPFPPISSKKLSPFLPPPKTAKKIPFFSEKGLQAAKKLAIIKKETKTAFKAGKRKGPPP
jgi:hypothetical protein